MRIFKTPASLDSKFLRAINACTEQLNASLLGGERREAVATTNALVSLNVAYSLYNNEGFEDEDGAPGWFMTKPAAKRMVRAIIRATRIASADVSRRAARSVVSLDKSLDRFWEALHA